ncbi:SusC/RagA family TonB-linked outer membrane protein [Pedobacter sp. HDW13]|uniref:SusC/RagA family TonB-linked outer membrane protein n=1 Tax=unclassified Pedobacter TaxID=2628915 RepID=UPI000F5A4411|nr:MULTISPECIES: SusC/RagA family TonB-linked outer membrane protein [unclassified Pedobacter]QIL39416.1 SusC/RagA family TonB-linked outer membrane protein [Pedobacter sp. HDW13]RQO71064.1 SusC/RagA family TonB-linked outer membrane protein [Pedobacter sp. KBW01]
MKKLLQSLFILVLCAFSAFAQERTVTGTVTSADDKLPIPGVSVKVQGTQSGAVTDASGKYAVRVPSGSTVLTFSFIGYAPQNRTIGGSSTVNVVLEADSKSLSEVVVTGAGLTARKKELGAAQTTLSNASITQAKPTNLVSGLVGKVAGLNIQGVGSGVNPNYRVVLRGMRSLTGNNQALIVVDNVIVPNTILSNINPDDVENLTVLNGSSAAALYGSAASNGALIITTKKGKKDGSFDIKIGNTTTLEQVAFFPKLQKEFGSGSDNDLQIYLPYENQQYGPRFDGVVRPIGRPLADGSIQMVPYSYTNSKDDFWDNGVTNFTDFSVSSGNDKGSLYASAQYMRASGTTPGDKYNRATVKIGGTRVVSDKITFNYSANYIQNRQDLTTQTGSIYNVLLNAPSQALITDYKDWRNNPYANPNGYYNAYYNNPYFLADNYRQQVRNDYFLGNAELKYKPLEWLDFTGRVGLTTQNQSSKNYSDIFKYSDYTKSISGSSEYKQQDILGGVSDNLNYTTNIVTDFIGHAQKKVEDFKFDLTVLGQLIQNQSKSATASVNGLVTAGVFNLGNSTNNPTASEGNSLTRSYGLTGKLDIGFKDYLFLSLTGRNDWVSVLAPENRSFFYPSATLSFVASDAIEAIKDIKEIDFIKLRGGWSKVGQVNIGAYSLVPTFGQGAGYPYNGQGGLSVGNTLISKDLKPEITSGFEYGVEASFFKSRVNLTATYYNTKTKDQTVPTGVSSTTGYTSYLVNAGQTTSKGWETSLNVVPFKTEDWEITLGTNYAYYDNTVDYISADLSQLTLGAYGGTVGSYAIAGQQFPVIQGTTHVRDSQGRIIVDRITGYPSATTGISILGQANAKHILGVNVNVHYKGFNLYGSGEYRGGNVIYNAAGSTFDFSGAGINSAAYNRDRFVIPNSSYLDPTTNTYVANTNITVRDGGPGYWTIAGPRTGINENYVTSGAFWKIRELALSYDVPAAFLAKSKVVKGARISVQGRNLFIFLPKTNVYTDPEYSDGNGSSSGNAIGLTNLNQTPPSRYYGATLTLTL